MSIGLKNETLKKNTALKNSYRLRNKYQVAFAPAVVEQSKSNKLRNQSGVR